jgi:hypothetical protein
MGNSWSNNTTSLIILVEQTSGFSGIFGYSPVPGLGNLIFSLSAAAGTDPYGNAYPQGLSSTLGSISGTTITGSTFKGTDFVINGSGIFVYNGIPAAGNLFCTIAAAAGTDSFGNPYGQGFNVGDFSASHFGIDDLGRVYVTNSAGVLVDFIDSATGSTTLGSSAAAHWLFDVPNSQMSMFDLNNALTARLSASAGNSNFVWLSNLASEYFAINGGALEIGRLTTPGSLPSAADQTASAKLALTLGPPDTLTVTGPTRTADPGKVAVQVGLKSGNAGTTLPGGANNPTLQVGTSATGVVDIELHGGALYRGDLSGWQTPSLGTGWAAGSIRSALPLRYMIDGQDNLVIKGSVSCTSTTPASTIFSVAAPYIPTGSYNIQQGVILKQSSAGGSFAFGHGFISAGAVGQNGLTFTSGDIVSLDFTWPLGNLP